MNPKVENLKGKLIVSCQALPDEPLHSSFIMGRMALAAKQGGASGIRANTPEDIKEIKTQEDLPVIGIIKRNYDDCEIYITPVSYTHLNEAKEEKKKQPQKLLLTWMVNEPQLFDKLEGIIGPDDFYEQIYHGVALLLFKQYEEEKAVIPGKKMCIRDSLRIMQSN